MTIQMLLAAPLLLASALHAGPERALHPPPRDAQPYEQILRDLAAGDGAALALWDEVHELRAARIDRDGNTLDPTPLSIAGSVWGHSAVSRGADGWLAVWSHHGGIAARIVGDDGTAGVPVTIATPEFMPLLQAAFDGGSHLVLWRDVTKYVGARLSATGHVLESGFDILPAQERHVGALLPDRDGGFVLVLWLRSIDVVHLDPLGRVRSSRRVATPADLRHVVAGFDASGELSLMWLDGLDIVSKRGDAAPELLERGANAASLAPRAVVAASGATYALFQREGDVVLRNLDSGAERVWDVAYLTMNARAVSFGDRLLVTAVTAPPPPPAGNTYEQRADLYVSVVDAALGEVEPARLLYVERRLQFHPAMAGDVAVWMESVDEERRKQIVARIGGGTPLVVADDASPITKPRVATSGDGFVVLWLGNDLRPWARHVRRDGTAGQPLRIADERILGRQCLVWTGSEYVAAFVVVKLAYRLALVSQVRAQPLSRDGAMIQPSVDLSGSGYYVDLACAASESSTLFAWEGSRIDGALRTHTGTVTAPFVIRFGMGRKVSVASNGTSFLTAWSSGPGVVERALVSAEGTAGTPLAAAGDAATAASRRGHYVLLTESLGTLTATPLDAAGQTAGEPVLLAHKATGAELWGSTVIYQRDTAALFMPRWQVFLRELATSTRRRTVR